MFDIYDISAGRYLDYQDMLWKSEELGLPTVPELGRVNWTNLDDLLPYAEGPATLGDNPDHVREGFVVRPLKERYNHKLGRVILKLHGEHFLLGKKKGKR